MTKIFKVFHMVGMAAITTALTLSCSDNDTAVDSGSEEEGINGTASYLAVNIKMADVAGSSRATSGGYEQYDSNDSADSVQTVCALFFNEDGSYLTAGNKDTLTTIKHNITDNIESTATPVITLGPTTIKPTDKIKMLLFINDQCSKSWYNGNSGVTSFSNLIGKNYNEVLDLTTNVTPSAVGSFEMTNSAYLNGNKTLVQATEVAGSHFKDSETEAKKDSVTAYVERTVAKVQMTQKDVSETAPDAKENTKPFTVEKTIYYPITNTNGAFASMTVNGKQTAFAVKVLRWGVNGVNTKGYLVKHITPDSLASSADPVKENNDKYTYRNGTGVLYTWNCWNDSTKFRSYWAEDVNYKDDTKGGTTSSSSLTFKKISELPSTSKTEYIYENTVQQYAAQYEGGTQHPNVTTMLVSAQICPLNGNFVEGTTTFTPTTDNNDSYVGTPVDLYRYMGAFYTKAEKVQEAAEASIVNSVLRKYYYKNNDKTTQVTDDYIKNNLSVIYDDTCTSVGDKYYNGIYYKVDSIRNSSGSDAVFYDVKGTVQSGVITAINSSLNSGLKSANKIEYFKNGKCFYQVPIEHPVNDKTTEEGKIYGVVRNHSYNLTLNSISNIGAPDTGKEETIELIPGKDNYYYLGCTVNVLAWRKVSQEVKL